MGGWWTDLWNTSLPGDWQPGASSGPSAGVAIDPGFMVPPNPLPPGAPDPSIAWGGAPSYELGPELASRYPWLANWAGGAYEQPWQSRQFDPIGAMQRQSLMQQWAQYDRQMQYGMGGV